MIGDRSGFWLGKTKKINWALNIAIQGSLSIIEL